MDLEMLENIVLDGARLTEIVNTVVASVLNSCLELVCGHNQHRCTGE